MAVGWSVIGRCWLFGCLGAGLPLPPDVGEFDLVGPVQRRDARPQTMTWKFVFRSASATNGSIR